MNMSVFAKAVLLVRTVVLILMIVPSGRVLMVESAQIWSMVTPANANQVSKVTVVKQTLMTVTQIRVKMAEIVLT